MDTFRIIYATDLHLKGKSPKSRKDDYLQAVIQKIQWVFQYAEEANADIILLGGDLFDAVTVSDSIKNVLIPIFRNTNRRIPIVSAIGSHDYDDYNMSTLDKTTLKVLENADALSLIHNNEIRNYASLNGDFHIEVSAINHTMYVEDNPQSFVLPKNSIKDSSVYRVQMIHAMVLQEPALFSHVLINDLPIHEMGDLILCGHYHPGFPVVHKDGKIIANPGALARKELTIRKPQIADVFIQYKEDSFIPTIQYVEIPCAEDVFRQDASPVLEQEREERMQQFLDAFADTSELSMNSDPLEVLTEVGKKIGKSDKAIQYVRDTVLKHMGGVE